jgi:beta-lactamase superfamily II metal-dependent hydrolase
MACASGAADELRFAGSPTAPLADDCEPSYPSVCIPIGHADYDCAQGSGNGPNFIEGPFPVQPPDTHRLDPDGDGTGCEGTGGAATATPGASTESFTIYFIDVGQGDATLVVTEGGQKLLVDGGRSKSRIRDRLNALGITELDAVLATHADADHIVGLVAVLEDYAVERVYWNGRDSDTQTFEDFKALWPEDGVVEVGRGDTINLGTLQIHVLHPGELSGDSNVDSIVLLVQCGTVDVLLTGDAEEPSEDSMLDDDVLVEVDVLKVGHHGSNTSTSQDFLDFVKPEFAVISAGLNSQYGHPHAETLEKLNDAGVQVFLTDTTTGPDGVTMSTDCTSVEFTEG